MNLNFAAKKTVGLCLAASLWAAACFGIAHADELYLKDGRVIAAEVIWETGDVVWYRQGKITASVNKTEIARIAKPKPASETNVAEANAAAKTNPRATVKARAKNIQPAPANPPVATPNNNETSAHTATRQVARILLKGGGQIDADSVWEDTERIGYRLGKMQSFVDRAEVVRVVREVPVNEEPGPPVVASAPLRYSTGHRGLDNLILYSAQRYNVDPLLIYLVMRQESSFNIRAVSRVGARGLMQLMPGTAARLGVRNIHDPVENVDAGTRYLRKLLEMFNGDMNLTLAAYNAGEGAVLKYGRRVPPYRETIDYVWKINTAYRRALADTASR